MATKVEIRGTVTKVYRHASKAGTPYLTVRMAVADSRQSVRLTFFHNHALGVPKVGDEVSAIGQPIVGNRVGKPNMSSVELVRWTKA